MSISADLAPDRDSVHSARVTTTPQMRRTLAAIAQHWSTHGVAPTVRELAKAQGLRSANGVQQTVDRLEGRGLVTRQVGLARTLRLTPEGVAEGGET